MHVVRTESAPCCWELGCTYVSSRTLPRFFSMFLYSTLSFPL